MVVFAGVLSIITPLDARQSQKVTRNKSGSTLEAAVSITLFFEENRIDQAVYTTVL